MVTKLCQNTFEYSACSVVLFYHWQFFIIIEEWSFSPHCAIFSMTVGTWNLKTVEMEQIAAGFQASRPTEKTKPITYPEWPNLVVMFLWVFCSLCCKVTWKNISQTLVSVICLMVLYLFAIPGSVQNKSGHNTTTLTLYYISCNWKRGKRWSSPSFVLCLVCGKIIETVAILRTFWTLITACLSLFF